jgi:hypothetical protein
MAINFNNGMSIQTDTNFRIIGSDGTTVRSGVDNSFGGLEKSLPVWRCVYAIGNNDSGQFVYPAGKITFQGDYGGEGNHYNFTTSEFICPVPGNYRMSMHVLHTGGVYAQPNDHSYGYINGTFISNGIHLVGATTNYATCQWIGVVKASAGDYLWFSNDGGRMYSGGWCVATYQLLG